MYFGVGLVKTVEDFGSQGEWPSNPELLDWLATEFVGSGWDVKAMQKTIVMSATYRQSSKVTPELLQKDPENRLLARGPRVRLPAEMMRDQALAVSGLLVDKIGGPSVKPYQPAGLWKELSGGDDYKPDHGDGLYRRSLYTFWKRTAPPPMMMNFDAAGRESLRGARVAHQHAAAGAEPDERCHLSGGGAQDGGADDAGRRQHAGGADRVRVRTGDGATARASGKSEILLASFSYYRDLFQSDASSRGTGIWRRAKRRAIEKLDARELAAYAAVASLILNLDATVTKN